MLIRPTAERAGRLRRARLRDLQRRAVSRPNRYTPGMTSDDQRRPAASSRGEIVILGTEYAGEMKKGVFTIMNYLMPQAGRALDALLGQRGRRAATSRSSSASPAPARRRSRPTRKRRLIGDDEHCWTDDGIFNIEGGCYAKVHRPVAEEASRRSSARIRFGTVLENVVVRPAHARGRLRRHLASPRTPAAPTRSSSSPTPRSPAWAAIRRTSSS